MNNHDFIKGVEFAANQVEKLAADFVSNSKSDGTRDHLVYEQGIGCERAALMLREISVLMKTKQKEL